VAFSYSLELGTGDPPSQVAAVLLSAGQDSGLLDSTVTVEDVLGGCDTKRDTRIIVLDGTSQFPWDEVAESFGFPARVRVAFRLGRAVEYRLQDDDVIRLVTAVLDRVPGDAVLHYQQEMVWLLRRGGELEVSERSDIWPPERLALLTPPYRRVTHHFV